MISSFPRSLRSMISSATPSIATTRASETALDEGWTWGAVPLLTFVAAIGVALVAVANRVAAGGAEWGDVPFFVGLIVIVIPIALRLLQVDVRGSERVALVVVLGMALYACKLLHDPVIPGGYDEFLHLRTAQDIVSNHVIFLPNSLLTVSPYYPGLELVTAAVSQMSGIGVYESGIIVLGFSRIALALALFFLFAMATSSSRVAGIAAAIYMTNSHFLYFDSQFAYESLALPLAVAVVYLLARRGRADATRWMGLTVLAVVGILGVVTTHHVTAALLALFLLLWAAMVWLLHRRDRSQPARFAVATTLLVVFWTVVVASATLAYLGPVLTASVGQLIDLVAGNIAARQLFVSRAGDASPLWEKLLGSASAGVVLLLLPLGLLIVRYRYRSTPIMVVFAILALAFPLTLVARFSPLGAEVASRTPEYLFLGIAPIMALTLARLAYKGRLGGFQMIGAAAVMVVLTIGGVLVGMPDWSRLPGPYLVSADGRSVDAQGVAAASWTLAKPWPGQQRRLRQGQPAAAVGLWAAAGHHDLRHGHPHPQPVPRSGPGPARRAASRGPLNIQYVLTDQRLTTGLPVVGHYFDNGRGGDRRHPRQTPRSQPAQQVRQPAQHRPRLRWRRYPHLRSERLPTAGVTRLGRLSFGDDRAISATSKGWLRQATTDETRRIPRFDARNTQRIVRRVRTPGVAGDEPLPWTRNARMVAERPGPEVERPTLPDRRDHGTCPARTLPLMLAGHHGTQGICNLLPAARRSAAAALVLLIVLPAAALGAGAQTTFNGRAGSVSLPRRVFSSTTLRSPGRPAGAGSAASKLRVSTDTLPNGDGQVVSIFVRRAGTASDYRTRIQFSDNGSNPPERQSG